MYASDRLLFALSARREVSWATYKEAFDILYASASGTKLDDSVLARVRSQTARLLDALGHCDVSFEEWEGRVVVAPAALARLPRTGLPEVVLTGARAPDTIQHLRAACKSLARPASLTVAPEVSDPPLIPRRITIQADGVEDLAMIARSLDIYFAEQPPAWAFAQFSGSLDAYLAHLDFAAIPEPGCRCQDFDPASLRFVSGRQLHGAVRLSRYSDPDRNVWVYLLWKDGRCARVDRDWGHYALLREAGASILLYDELRGLFAVPASAPLPRLLARALALCSGMTPAFVPIREIPESGRETWGYTTYADVPEQIAALVANKVSQTLVRRPLNDIS